jgi:hypothetical protein
MSVLMIFIDGVGIGENDRDKNPFARFPSPFFSTFINPTPTAIPFDGLIIPTDPSMGLPGLPQSATGQTALLTGLNASQKLGRHLSGFPSPTLRKILSEESIFLKIERLNKVATFANAFTPEYFQRPARRISATTWAVKASNFPFRMLKDDLLLGRAVSHDLTNGFLSKLGYEVPIRTPETSAEILAEIAGGVDFCLFEFILTDVIGHDQDMPAAEMVISRLTTFLDTLLHKIDLSRHLLLLTSDHGNFEDLSVSTHTHHLVPTMLWGRGKEQLAPSIRRIEDVPRAILSLLQNQ